ncbi:cysteine-rich repeat secretory protein 38-like [Carica papaya]|uniref:cysteine-rich repeat secretory protein 38-like n=1 Tax=Carica papaya TaxID=3649 RepID=UPI000B8CE79B|nr:cysteine-rich repeat secretory protein 38-like [Carica papaya]
MKYGWECSVDDNSTSEISFINNLNNLWILLADNAAFNNGFYKTAVGNDSDKLYGLTQCRGDISAADCANCTRESVKVAVEDCPRNTSWGVMFNGTDHSSIGSKGLDFMTELATTAPEQPLLFQIAVLDGGENGKRYGMAQCSRDLSKSNCSKCLEFRLEAERTENADKRGWEIYSSSCSMWYQDYQFYFNSLTAENDGGRRSSSEDAVIVITMAVLMLLLIV